MGGIRRGSKPLTWVVDEATGCWNVTSHALDGNGYPVMTVNHKTVLIGRYLYEQEHGPIPDRMCICHTCDNPRCINPEHRWLGTQGENLRDMVAKGRCLNPKGAAHYRAKLTDDQVRYIREHTEIKGREIARMMGVSEVTVSNIRSGRKWKHLLA